MSMGSVIAKIVLRTPNLIILTTISLRIEQSNAPQNKSQMIVTIKCMKLEKTWQSCILLRNKIQQYSFFEIF